jgi:hypothetical protein
MSPSLPATAADRLLHCSPGRTVVERCEPGGGEPAVVKIYVAGSAADAAREHALGVLAAGPGVVAHLRTGPDAASGRPCVVTRREPGVDLDRLVAARGALPAAFACELVAGVADTLARLHGLRTAAAPAGLCHGDVKPKNLLHGPGGTVLLDFEHAHAIGSGARGPIGTHGFAAPEAGAGAVTAAIDVWALGATLAWLLAGGARRMPPQDPAVLALIAACRHTDPRQRPGAAAVAARARELARALATDASEARLHDWASAAMQLPPPPPDEREPRARAWSARARLLARTPHAAAVPGRAATDDPAALRSELAANARALWRFPRHEPLLQRRRELLDGVARALANAAAHTAAGIRAEAFDAAHAWLRDLGALLTRALATPGGVPFPADDGPGLAQRDALAFVQRLHAQVDAARGELQDELERVASAERRLDVRGAEAAVDAMAVRCGGTSPTAARQRDRLHRLSFYLDRVARADANVERVTPLWDAAALQPLTAFVAAAAQARVRSARADGNQGTVGLRSLQLTLQNLAEDFAHVPQVAPALEALSQALLHLTDQAWQLLGTARQQLQALPVPVRPLQLTLGRLDSLRVLEAFVDRPQRPRSELLDGIESLRLQLEQARAARDRLAESAESALARGHWTTGLFDMERAVAGLGAGGADDREHDEATRLQQRLQQARQRKQEVEAAVRRNVELGSAYGTLQDDSASTFEGRLQVLEERRDTLLFLTMHVPAERSVLYRRDLRDVDTQIALERAGLAEHQLDATVDPEERLRLVRATLEQLSTSLQQQSEPGFEPPGRVVRLLEHWRTTASHCQRAVEQLHAGRALRARQRRRVLVLAVVALVVTTTAIAFAVGPWLQAAPAMASGK